MAIIPVFRLAARAAAAVFSHGNNPVGASVTSAG